MKGIFKLVFTIQKVICCIMIYGGIFCSCTKFLKEENKTQYSVDYIYSSTEGLKLSVNALYALQRNLFNDNNGNEEVQTLWQVAVVQVISMGFMIRHILNLLLLK